MVTPPANQVSVLTRLLRDTGPEQLRLPMEVPGEAKTKFFRAAKDFATGFTPKLGSKLLMKFGIPMVAATTPVVIRLINPDWEDEVMPNLLIGSALGGAWGAAVGAMLPFTEAGVKVSRLRSAGTGAAGGILLAPAVALASKYVADWLTSPIERARDNAEDRADDAERELEQSKRQDQPATGTAGG
jgi:hypothetical protein